VATIDDLDWSQDLRESIRGLAPQVGRPVAATGHVPPMDIVERPDALEILVDVAGICPTAIHVIVRGSRLLITGHKQPACACTPGLAAFHVAERTFGRFARAIPLRMAFDASAVRATLKHGELRIVVPRLEDRRGREIEIPIDLL
jgi:HSP20 family protein